MSLDPVSPMLEGHRRDLQREARNRRLSTLAACCRPHTWRRAAQRARLRLHRTRRS